MATPMNAVAAAALAVAVAALSLGATSATVVPVRLPLSSGPRGERTRYVLVHPVPAPLSDAAPEEAPAPLMRAHRLWSPDRHASGWMRPPGAVARRTATHGEWESLTTKVVGVKVESKRLAKSHDPDGADGSSYVTVALKGGYVDGDVYAMLQAGSQGYQFNTMIDTGSSDYAVPSTLCGSHCNTSHTLYDPTRSGKPLECTALKGCSCTKADPVGQCFYKISYVDNSGYTANVYQDSVSVLQTTLGATSAHVGAIVEENGWAAKLDSIAGAALPEASAYGSDSVLMKMLDDANLPRVFSLCIERNNGVMMMGGYSESAGPLQWTDVMESNGGYYTIDCQSMSVDGHNVNMPDGTLNDGMCIVDSGTSGVIIPTAAWDALYAMLKGTVCDSTDLVGICNQTKAGGLFGDYPCYQMTVAQRNQFPDITVGVRGDISLVMPPANYLPIDGGYACLAFEEGDDGDGTILGDALLRAYQTAHDRTGSPVKVGFSPSSACSS